MTEITLTARTPGKNSSQTVLEDKVLETGGILIDQNAYSTGLERLYDVKGLKDMHVDIINEGGSNGLTFTIEKTPKEFTNITDLVDADFSPIKGDTNVAFGTNNISDIVDISPETTAIRIRIKRQTSGQDTTLGGFVSVN